MGTTTVPPPLDVPLWQVDKDVLAGEVRDLVSLLWLLDARLGSVLAEIDARGCHELFGYRGTAEWLHHLARMTRQEAKKLVERATATHPGQRLDGTPTVPLAPLAGAAAGAGEIGPHHVARIVGVLKKIPAEVPEETRAGVEKILVDLAHEAGPAEIDKAGAEALARLDEDGTPPKDDSPGRRRPELRIRERKDGWYDLDGQLDPVTGARLVSALEPLAKPRPGGETVWPEIRTPQERTGEAFAEFVQAAMSAPEISVSDRAQLLVSVSLTDLQEGLDGLALDLSAPLTAGEARRIACDCSIIPMVLNSTSELLDLGHSQRLISKTQRKALARRDRGCSFPGCTRKPRYCDGHHIRSWFHGGKTDLCNLTLLCAHHHRLVHASDWEIEMAPDGLPVFIPPANIDPSRRPRRNTLHPELRGA